ncbi:hypothetical protein KIH74_08000 [Kineosporia sp. J2-2]|uniref:Uncharacterized protein n=1 Tax=Kineosporia corallincola TaxID=2835133 RepID=A0ABS5TGY4_9ACTN|nr:hypothetical protein [Kineosporia corallincola]MBT0768864.1 hypothetical protein [Kineosporia corallincola]
MTQRRISRKSAAIGVAAIVGLGGGAAGVAYAYPSGVPLTLSASATGPDGDGNSVVTLTLGNNDGRCGALVTVDGVSQLVPAGQSTATITVAAGSGRHRARVRTVDCALDERARVDFVVPDAAISGPTDGQAGDSFRYELSGLEPGTTVSVQAVLTGGDAVYGDTDTVNKRGEAKVKFRIKVAGEYVVTASVAGNVVASTTVTVN